ncbi:TRCF domain-containing protein [Mesorhizobium sp. BAC0120]|uniref:DEAD/DEAH box helicase n=1 Tax=Mesorhizobium sp. BAC0120 TaxID=3090670 RepID=UPI00298C8A0E|nr:DEAD/DEAH box helicase [Mesorhizobium sp. BAC0120]MDW6025925.1 TRCF domain-containing protein [Mesorhizobium sp. BAC0120]
MSGKLPVGATAIDLLALVEQSDDTDLVFVTASERRARRVARFLQAVCSHWIVVFPPWDCLPYDRILPSREIIGERMKVLRMLTRPAERTRIVITTPDAALQRVPPRSALRTFELRVGQHLDPDEFRCFCELAGYVLDDRVDEVGEAALRGEVIDIFPAGSPSPVRLEMRNGKIGAIRPYDPLSQRTQGALEFLLLDAVLEGIPAHGLRPPEGEAHSRAQPQMETLFDYLPTARLVIEPSAGKRCEAVLAAISEAYRDRIGTPEGKAPSRHSVPEPSLLFLEPQQWSDLVAHRAIRLQSRGSAKPVPFFASAPRPGRAFVDFLHGQIAAERRIVLTAASGDILERLCRRAEGATARHPEAVSDWQAVLKAGKPSILSLKADLEEGFLDEERGIAVVAAPDVLGSRIRGGQDARSIRPAYSLSEAAQFHLGDLVVHIDHGIGALRDLERVDAPESPQEAIRLGYAKDATLLVPSDDADKLWQYGSNEGAVPLDRLDGDGWLRRRSEIERVLERTARAMHAYAARRKEAKAPKLLPPLPAYERFVARFPFSETPDQSSAIEAVLKDLASGQPMDRLVVGDVGFGKTEVALRAAAAAAFSGKQVAIAVPTTVLARQHFNTFKRRFAGLGIEVAHLSRLVGRKEAAYAKKGLADGSVQVVVGTHALAGKTVAFADAGLLVIDEEHRFGAAHKRKLRKMADGIHVLTLTATPIPRTLQIALIGLQDLSVITTPPSRRRPIRTFCIPFERELVGVALRREKRRGGQSFVVVPRIEDIEPTLGQLRAVAADLDIKVVHGKLPAAKVDETFVAFSEGRGDVLLSTSIIESGLDVPAANTMIVLRAELFGLAELHQLRGRVGRGSQQAFCYLMTEPGSELPESTLKRLDTLRVFDQLGAGMEIAARDLGLRGAGDLMGEEQAGHVRLIGIGLYQELLSEAIRRVGGEQIRHLSTDFQINTPARVPEDYIPEPEIRLNLYHRAARASEPADIDRLADEIADRFGPPPGPVRTLLELAAIRTLGRSLKIVKIAAGPKAIALTFQSGSDPRGTFGDHLAQSDGDLEWKSERLILRKRSDNPEQQMRLVLELLTSLHES